MSVILEDVLVRIQQLPPAEIALLRDLLNNGLRDQNPLQNVVTANLNDSANSPSVEPDKLPEGCRLEDIVSAVFGASANNSLIESIRGRRLAPISVPDQSGALRWLAENARAYKGQWVALDGERLIAHGKDAHVVYAAAKADGAYLPLVELVEDPDGPPFAGF